MSSPSALAQPFNAVLEERPMLLAVAEEARRGLAAQPKALSPWLFYDEAGSRLFDEITRLPEYYLTRTERDLFETYADEVFTLCAAPLTVVELGAGNAAKTGVLLDALRRRQPRVLYQPIDISSSALEAARASLADMPGLQTVPTVANYLTESVGIERIPGTRVLALSIGSSIGNFAPAEARDILRNLRDQLLPGDLLLLGTDLAPSFGCAGPWKGISTLIGAYNDSAGVTAAFNRNVLRRLNRELRANFRLDRFQHDARWNAVEFRMEMHLESTCAQTVVVPGGNGVCGFAAHFAPGETIHTENSYKFTPEAIGSLVADSGYRALRTFIDANNLFAVTLAEVRAIQRFAPTANGVATSSRGSASQFE